MRRGVIPNCTMRLFFREDAAEFPQQDTAGHSCSQNRSIHGESEQSSGKTSSIEKVHQSAKFCQRVVSLLNWKLNRPAQPMGLKYATDHFDRHSSILKATDRIAIIDDRGE